VKTASMRYGEMDTKREERTYICLTTVTEQAPAPPPLSQQREPSPEY